MGEPWKKHGRLAAPGPSWKDVATRVPRPQGALALQELQDQNGCRDLGKGVRRRRATQPPPRVSARIDAPEVLPDATPIGELILEWLATDAHPDSTGGLARQSWDTYRSVASRHIIGNPIEQLIKKTGEIAEVASPIKPLGHKGGYAIGDRPIADFESADVLKRWVQAMRAAGVTRATEAKAWTVISSALSWAIEDDSWPISINGCLTMQRRRGMRRASRRAGTGAARQVAAGKRRNDLPSWALSPLAVERIRLVMLERLGQRPSLLALRDALAVSVQYGLAMRNQEIWALTFGDVAGRRATVREVLSYGALDVGKTEGATGARADPRSTRSLLMISRRGGRRW